MKKKDIAKIRQRLSAHLDRKPYGEIQGIAETVGISRQHLSRFRAGGNVSLPVLRAIEQAMEGITEQATAEEQRPYRTDAPGAMLRIAEELERLTKVAREPGVCTIARLAVLRAGAEYIRDDLISRLEDEIDAGSENSGGRGEP